MHFNSVGPSSASPRQLTVGSRHLETSELQELEEMETLDDESTSVGNHLGGRQLNNESTPERTPETVSRDNQPQRLLRRASMVSVMSEASHTPADHSGGLNPFQSPRMRSVSPVVVPPRSPGAASQLSRAASFASRVGDNNGATIGAGLTRRRSTFRQTSLNNAAVAGRREAHRPLMSRDFPSAKVESSGLLNGLVAFFRCTNAVTLEKAPCCDTNDEYMHLRIMTEDEKEELMAVYSEGEVANTIVLAPALLIAFLLAVVIYCGIIVFWAPNTRLYAAGGLPWRKGDVNASEAILPMVMAVIYVIAIAYANSLGISFTLFERQFMIEPEVLSSLHGREVALTKDALETLASINSTCAIPFARECIVKKVRWYYQEGRESLPADLYVNYINSLASISCVKAYKMSMLTSAANIVLPLIVALAPMSARIFSGGSIWGNGLAEEFGLVICGPLLTMVCCYGIVAMLNLFAFTMRFHRRRMEWISMCLPDPTRLVESAWPTLRFDNVENVLIWHRLRATVEKPPMALYLWGRRLSEATFVLFILLVVLSMAYNFVNQQPSIYDGSTAITIALLITLAPMLLYIFYTPLRSTFLRQADIDALSRILMLSVKDIGLERGTIGVTDEALQKIADIRSVIKVVTRSIAQNHECLYFLGFPIGVTTMAVMVAVFVLATGLVLMRGVYANETFI